MAHPRWWRYCQGRVAKFFRNLKPDHKVTHIAAFYSALVQALRQVG